MEAMIAPCLESCKTLHLPSCIRANSGKQSSGMARVERKRNPTLEEMQQAYAQRRLIMETPQIPPFDRGNLSTVMDFLEKIASLENRRQKAKLAGDSERIAEMRTNQKKLASSEQGQLLRQFELTFWGRVLAGAFAQGVVLSIFISLLQLAFSRHWHWSPLSMVTVPIIWVVLLWGLAPPVWSTSGFSQESSQAGSRAQPANTDRQHLCSGSQTLADRSGDLEVTSPTMGRLQNAKGRQKVVLDRCRPEENLNGHGWTAEPTPRLCKGPSAARLPEPPPTAARSAASG